MLHYLWKESYFLLQKAVILTSMYGPLSYLDQFSDTVVEKY